MGMITTLTLLIVAIVLTFYLYLFYRVRKERKNPFLREQRHKKMDEFQRKINNMDTKIKSIDAKIVKLTILRLYHVAGAPGVRQGYVYIRKGERSHELLINHQSFIVTRCDWIEKTKRNAGKAAIGALIGDSVAGVPGILVGGAIGGRRRNDALSALTTNYNELETVIYFRTNASEHQKLLTIL